LLRLVMLLQLVLLLLFMVLLQLDDPLLGRRGGSYCFVRS
jgi:hypothetical protein